MSKQEVFLELKNVSKSYDNGYITAVKDISLSLEKGKIYALMGKSGCGKSTLLNMIGTLDVPTSGEIYYNAKSINMIDSLNDFRRNFIGLIFQFHHLIPILTVGRNIEIAMLSNLSISKEQRQVRVHTLLQEMGLETKIDTLANKISGGERQRVAIARALANHPSLILADEPTGSVDTQTSKVILNKLKDHVALISGTMIIATHDPLVSTIADEIINMQDGKIISITQNNHKI